MLLLKTKKNQPITLKINGKKLGTVMLSEKQPDGQSCTLAFSFPKNVRIERASYNSEDSGNG